jgi:hypothetical protein
LFTFDFLFFFRIIGILTVQILQHFRNEKTKNNELVNGTNINKIFYNFNIAGKSFILYENISKKIIKFL